MIKSLAKGLSILELLAKERKREISLGEIADSLGMDHGTCANIIKTLSTKGYVQQSAPRKGYSLGYMLYSLTESDVLNDDLTKTACEDITRLGQALNESAILSTIKNDKRVVLFQTMPDREIIARVSTGKAVYSANTGRVILANYSVREQEKFISRVGLPTHAEWAEVADSANPKGELMNLLAEIRQHGYSIQRDSNNIAGCSAPLFRGKDVAGSIGVYMPLSRLTDMNEVISAVLATADSINDKLKALDTTE